MDRWQRQHGRASRTIGPQQQLYVLFKMLSRNKVCVCLLLQYLLQRSRSKSETTDDFLQPTAGCLISF